MKQFILILVLAVTFTSCIKDEVNDCTGYLRLSFLYDGTAEGYDERIGNDIHLRIYRNNILHSAGIIPYERIAGGQEYLVRKEVTGEIDIVAWAIPSGEDWVGEIPTIAEDYSKTGELLQMQPRSRSLSYHSIGLLYLGTMTHDETNLTEETAYPVLMNDCVAQFTAAIHHVPDHYIPGQEKNIWLTVHGTKSAMDIDFTPLGEDAIVYAAFTEKEEDGVIRTTRQGLLPSAEDQYLAVDIYRGDEYQGRIETDIQARPGDFIHLDIYRDRVTIYVNDWRVFETSGADI
ncbi:MAG: FimB/Mfa2 family fimbrial subunit [Tannerellaceae bacterium]|nr:FimB/Mfa2 family fimbrial subunit [Tannerellaceae bacterium]